MLNIFVISCMHLFVKKRLINVNGCGLFPISHQYTIVKSQCDGPALYFYIRWYIWYLVVCPGSFALTSLTTGQFSQRVLQGGCWKLFYMKINIFPWDAFVFGVFFQKWCTFSVIFVKCNFHEFVMSS